MKPYGHEGVRLSREPQLIQNIDAISVEIQPRGRIPSNLLGRSYPSDRDEYSIMDNLLDYPDADIILRSIDERDFRVLKLFIIKSSPVLDKLIHATPDLTAVTIPTSTETRLPVVHMSESGEILHNLLTFILPVPPVLPPNVEKTLELLSVAQKYEMNHILAHIRGRVALQNPPLFSKSNALHVYSLSQKYGLRPEVVQAARLTLKSTLTIENLDGKLDVMPGDHLHELWRYHQRVKENLLSNIDVFRGSGAYKALNCLKCVALASSGIPKWIDDHIKFMARTPSYFDLFEFQSTLARHLTQQCICCTSLPRQVMDEFWTALSTFFHANMEQAELTFEINSSSNAPIDFSKVTPPLPECLDVSDADIVIQSCDLSNFRVRKSILASSSPFFRDLFSLPQPSKKFNETVDGLPVVRLSEDAELVRALITVLYPIPPEIPASYERVLALLSAAQKYDMSAVPSSIRAEVIRRALPAPTGAQAFRAFAFAFSNNLSPETGTAARLTLDSPLTFEILGDELRVFRGSALRDLVGFRGKCRDNIVSCLESFLNAHRGPSNIWVGCPGSNAQASPPVRPFNPSGSFGQPWTPRPQPGSVVRPAANGDNKRTLPPWLHDFFKQQIGELKRHFTHALLKPSSIREKYLSALMKHSPTSNDCPTCMVVHVHKGEGYCAELEQKLTLARNQAGAAFEFRE